MLTRHGELDLTYKLGSANILKAISDNKRSSMPKDGSISREKILRAARGQFLEKGFEGASIRAIAADAGLTSAALYRHFESKHELFAALVKPGMDAIDAWMTEHTSHAYADAASSRVEQAASRSEVDMMREVVFPNRETFKLLLCCAQGTEYENFIHDLVERQQTALAHGLVWLRQQGFPAKDVNDETLHMLVSAFTTALFEPIVHDYPQEDAMQYYRTMERFFLPGWYDILGI